MKHLWKWTACAILIFAATALASAQEPLGDVARQERARPKPHAPKVITNEDIPSIDAAADDSTSTDEKKATDADADAGDKDKDKAKDKDKDKDKDKFLSAEDKSREIEQWKGKIAAQESTVKQLDQQVAEIDRDYKLRMSALYADLGTRLRDQAQWAADEKKFQDEMAAKQKERDAAREKLDEIKDEARHAGVHGVD